MGWGGDPAIGEGAFAAVFRHTSGIPRRINILCNWLLLPGFMDKEHAVAGGDVVEVIENLEQKFLPAAFPACAAENKTPAEGTGNTVMGRDKRKPMPAAFETDENGEAQ